MVDCSMLLKLVAESKITQNRHQCLIDLPIYHNSIFVYDNIILVSSIGQ